MNLKTVLIASVAVVALVAVGVYISMPSATDTSGIGSGSVSDSYLKTIGERISKLEEVVNEHSVKGNDSAAAVGLIEAIAAAAKSGLDLANVPKGIESEHQALYDAVDAMELACAGLYFDDYEADSEPEPVADPYICYDKFDAVADAWAKIREKSQR